MSKKPEPRRLAPADGRDQFLAELRTVEVRAAIDGGPIGFKGIASVFGKPTKIGGRWGWWEQIDRHAFDSALDRPDDVRMLKNHNTDLPLARTTADNLHLSASDAGLEVDADMVPTTYAQDLALTLDARVVSQMSFAFSGATIKFEVLEEDQSWGGKAGDELDTILDVGKLWEVSPVTFPAYVDTEADLKSFDRFCHDLGIDAPDERQRLVLALRSGDPSPDLAERLRAAAIRLDDPATPPASGTPDTDGHAGRASDTPELNPGDVLRDHRANELTRHFSKEMT